LSSDIRTRRPRPTSARSGLTRLADAARAVFPAEAATVDGAERPVVGVVRGFDSPSRLRARVLRAKLESRGLRPLDLTTLAAGHGGTGSPAPPRLLIDSTGRSTSRRGPASRLAARIGVPLVALSTSPDPVGGDSRGPQREGPRRETRVVLTVHGGAASSGTVLLDVALDDLVLRPDSDAARLDVQVEDRPVVEDVPGAVRVRPDLVQTLAVELSGPQAAVTGAGSTVRLTPRAASTTCSSTRCPSPTWAPVTRWP
jgi:hypothetical protein